MQIFTLTCTFVAWSLVARVQPITQCSLVHRSQSMASCLRLIGALAQDQTQFWFGSSFNQRCPDGPQEVGLECSLPWGLQIPQSIASMVFRSVTFNPNVLDRYLDINYTSPEGEYEACGNTYRPSADSFTIDPILAETHDCWALREIPEISWRSAPGQLFSLLIQDVGFGFMHGIYVNIQGNNLTNAEIVKPYRGPLNPRRDANVYVFLLFKQSQPVEVDPRFVNTFTGFNVSEFAEVYGLTGPVAMNWVLATGDPYSVEEQRRMGVVNNCPSFISELIPRQNRSFLPNDVNFEIFLDVTYESKRLEFMSCCESAILEAKTVKANPIADGIIEAGHAREPPEVDLTITKVRFNPETDFTDKLYTLAMVGPDATGGVATSEMPLLHWLKINIQNGIVENGIEEEFYLGPSPLDNTPHFYYFLLYKQQGVMSPLPHKAYTSPDCTGLLANRCHFNVTAFAAENGLELVGASWFASRRPDDKYVRFQRIERGQSEEELCVDVAVYTEMGGDCHGTASGSWTIGHHWTPTLIYILTFMLFYF